jgi:hypothetical protein
MVQFMVVILRGLFESRLPLHIALLGMNAS